MIPTLTALRIVVIQVVVARFALITSLSLDEFFANALTCMEFQGGIIVLNTASLISCSVRITVAS